MGAAEAIAFAQSQLGKPYEFGATGPNSYDCSGLVEKACEAGGVHVGRTTYEQIFNGTEVSRSDLMPGDLLFPDPGHVQLYIGNNQVIEAPHTGAFVRITQVWGFWRARRVFDPSTSVTSIVDELNKTYPVFNPLDPTGLLSKVPVLGKLEQVGGILVQPNFWKRIGIGVLGVLVVVLGIVFVSRHRIEAAAGNAAKVAGVAAL